MAAMAIPDAATAITITGPKTTTDKATRATCAYGGKRYKNCVSEAKFDKTTSLGGKDANYTKALDA